MRRGPDEIEVRCLISNCVDTLAGALDGLKAIKVYCYEQVLKDMPHSYTESLSGLQRLLGVKPETYKTTILRSVALRFFCSVSEDKEIAIEVPYYHHDIDVDLLCGIEQVLVHKGLLEEASDYRDIRISIKPEV